MILRGNQVGSRCELIKDRVSAGVVLCWIWKCCVSAMKVVVV